MLQKNVGGAWLARVGGRGWESQPAWDFRETVMFAGTRLMGVFDGDCSRGGGG
jgi:hypothetical protein